MCTIGCLCSLNQSIMGSINTVESMNAGKKTCCLHAVHIRVNVQLAIGRNINSAAIRHRLHSHSPIPAIFHLVVSVETSLSNAL